MFCLFFFQILAKIEMTRIKIGYLAAILKRYNILFIYLFIYFILFYFILFYFILFYFILFYFIFFFFIFIFIFFFLQNCADFL